MIEVIKFIPIFGRNDHREIVDKMGDLVDKQKELEKRLKSGRGVEKAQKEYEGLVKQINEMILKAKDHVGN